MVVKVVKSKLRTPRNKKVSVKSTFFTKNVLIITTVLISVGLVVGLVLYFRIFNKSSTSSSGGGNTPTLPTVPGQPTVNPIGPGIPNPPDNTTKIVGAWINAANPPWTIIPNMDIIILFGITETFFESLSSSYFYYDNTNIDIFVYIRDLLYNNLYDIDYDSVCFLHNIHFDILYSFYFYIPSIYFNF